jgi:hypothetical protein
MTAFRKLLREIVSDMIDPEMNILSTHGYEASLMERSGTATVFNTTHDGAPAVAKVSRDHHSWETTEQLQSLESKLPPQYRRHLIRILDSYVEDGYYVTVEEKLVPLTSDIVEKYWSDRTNELTPEASSLKTKAYMQPFPLYGDMYFDNPERKSLLDRETQTDPEMASFLECLVYMNDRLGVSWEDLSHDNVMMRPETGTLVLADTGEFLMENLTEAGLKFQGEDEDVSNQDIRILRSFGLTPIKGGQETSLVGEGGYSRVYNVLYKGEQAMAKVTESRSDVTIPVKLERLRRSLPEKFQRHVLHVYAAYQRKATRFEDAVYVLVVEPLLPLSSSDTTVEKMFKYMCDVPDEDEPDVNDVKDIFSDEATTLKSLRRLTKIPEDTLEAAAEALRKAAEESFDWFDFIHRGIEALQRVTDPNDVKSINQLLRAFTMIRDSIKTQLLTQLFPCDHPEDEEPVMRRLVDREISGNPELESLLEFLRYLKSEHSISWADMSMNNIMVRPFDRDYVLSDPGLFEV